MRNDNNVQTVVHCGNAGVPYFGAYDLVSLLVDQQLNLQWQTPFEIPHVAKFRMAATK